MSGVELVYELATPLIYDLDEPLYLGYPVDDFGTEKILPENTSTSIIAQPRVNIDYIQSNVEITDVNGLGSIVAIVNSLVNRVTALEKENEQLRQILETLNS